MKLFLGLVLFGSQVNMIISIDNNRINKQSLFNQACNSLNLELIKLLLESGININQLDENNVTLLYSAIEKGRLDIAEYLIDLGADVNIHCLGSCQHDMDDTPLISSIVQNRFDITQILINAGAKINDKTIAGRCPENNALIYACSLGHYDCVKLLIDAGADVNCICKSNDNFYSPICPLIATIRKHTKPNFDIFKLLISHGADVNFKTISYINGLDYRDVVSGQSRLCRNVVFSKSPLCIDPTKGCSLESNILGETIILNLPGFTNFLLSTSNIDTETICKYNHNKEYGNLLDLARILKRTAITELLENYYINQLKK